MRNNSNVLSRVDRWTLCTRDPVRHTICFLRRVSGGPNFKPVQLTEKSENKGERKRESERERERAMTNA